MPFFAREMGNEVWGVDYSSMGLDAARRNMDLLKIEGHFVLGDFMTADLRRESFRVIFSQGVIEHYSDPLPFFRRALDLLEPGGVVVTVIPNLVGFLGWGQRWIDAKMLALHMPYDHRDLDRLQEPLGLVPVMRGQPFGVMKLNIMNFDRWYHAWPPFLARLVGMFIEGFDRCVGWLFYPISRGLDGRFLSPFFVSIYRKP
jgi:2-polyprenyl-3-methyl-5-hydroxy-6-metoxy-1,4-benzoquinol methylase